MAAKGYRVVLEWLLLNDDTEWLDDPAGRFDDKPVPSVTACLVADLYGKHQDQVTVDLYATRMRLKKAGDL